MTFFSYGLQMLLGNQIMAFFNFRLSSYGLFGYGLQMLSRSQIAGFFDNQYF